MVRGFSESIVSDYENVYCCLGLSLFGYNVYNAFLTEFRKDFVFCLWIGAFSSESLDKMNVAINIINHLPS